MNGTAYAASSDQVGIRSIHNSYCGLLRYIPANNLDHLKGKRLECALHKYAGENPQRLAQKV